MQNRTFDFTGHLVSQLVSMSGSAGAAIKPELGDLPSWNLADLFPSKDSPEFKAALEKATQDSLAFETRWKDKLADAATKSGDDGLGAAIRDYDALDDILGRRPVPDAADGKGQETPLVQVDEPLPGVLVALADLLDQELLGFGGHALAGPRGQP